MQRTSSVFVDTNKIEIHRDSFESVSRDMTPPPPSEDMGSRSSEEDMEFCIVCCGREYGGHLLMKDSVSLLEMITVNRVLSL
ncbi:hypothetical protein RB195_006896 [Necator americanus]|uniref:Uncharacterized protein n=1 Tax=Necator americanus TaxID=51031 RepID=A0ABR1BWF2_NECAM